MGFTYITGIDSVALDKIKTSNMAEDYLDLIVGGNTEASMASQELSRVLENMRMEFPRKHGTPIPVEETVVKFADGDTQTATNSYLSRFGSFKTKIKDGKTAMIFDISDNDMRNLTSEQINKKIMRNTKAVVGTYQNYYRPYSVLCDMLTGTSFNDTIPALASGTEKGMLDGIYGIARGELYNNYLLPTATSMNRNHFLTIKGAVNTPLSSSDIQRAIKLVKETTLYGRGGGSQAGVLVLGNPFTIQNLSNIYNDTKNKDLGIFGEAIQMYDAYFKPIEGFHDDFLVFIDMSYEERLIAHGVNEDPEQRGFGIYAKKDLETFETFDDLRGEKLYIFEEENYFVNKLSALVMDVNPARANTNGKMTTASETVLNSWIANMRATYTETL